MKKEWLVANVTAVKSLDRADNAIFGGYWLGVILANPGHICGRGATLLCRNPLLSSNNFTLGNSMKIEWLGTNVTAIGSPGRAERAALGMIMAGRIFGQFRTYLWSLSHFVMLEPSFELE